MKKREGACAEEKVDRKETVDGWPGRDVLLQRCTTTATMGEMER